MSDHIGAGYGSEYHLMRYMARYRGELNREIENKIGVTIVNWLDFKHKNKNVYNPSEPAKVILPDQELEGLEFIKEGEGRQVLKKWKTFWPQKGTQHNWDAVAKIKIDSCDWLVAGRGQSPYRRDKK